MFVCFELKKWYGLCKKLVDNRLNLIFISQTHAYA